MCHPHSLARWYGKRKFFGGNSESTGRNTKVRSRVVAHALRELIQRADVIFVTGHKNSDADSLGASVAVCKMASLFEKKAYIIIGEMQSATKRLVDELKKEDAYKEKIEQLEDKVMRQMAEFDNFRKRTEKEKTQMYEIGAKSIIEKILPVVDNFERGLATIPEEEKGSPFAEGMSMIYKQLMTELESAGVKPIEAVGTEFNPDFHNAVMHVEDEEAGENVIVEEFQKGYLYKDQVVRHSMVKVAN